MPILTPEERLGQRVAERYQLDAVLSSGGMGVLFRATDHDTSEQVAVKMLKPMHTLDPSHVARFVREIRIGSTIRHPNIVRVLDVSSDEAGVPFLVMELLHGRSLAQELERRKTLPFSETLAIAIPIASALEAAHTLGTVHRDIKPSNIFLCDEPTTGGIVPKLLDFGIAKSAQNEFETDTGFLIGTPGYMAPEHAQYGECCPSTDIWGLGAVIYSCLAGHPPHASSSVHEMLGKLVRQPVPTLDVAGVGKRASATIDRALARDPQLRYPSVAAFRSALSMLASADTSTPDETATFYAAEFAIAARTEALVQDDPQEQAEPANTASSARRTRRRVVAAACVAAVLLSMIALVQVGARLHAAARLGAPALEAPVLAPSSIEVNAGFATTAMVSATPVATVEPMFVATDALTNGAASVRPLPERSHTRETLRPPRARGPSRKPDEPEHVTEVPNRRVVARDPMDRRR